MLFSFLLPALALLQAASALPAAPVQVSRNVDPQKIEAAFKAVHDKHQEEKISIAGDIFNPSDPSNVVTTRNELIEGGCKDIIVIFAR